MPGGGVADRDSYLLDEDEEGACPDGGAVNLACGPQIVGHKNEKEDVGRECGRDWIAVAPDWPTGDGGDHQCDGADEDEPFVGCGIGTGAEGEEDERREDEHVGQGDDVEEFRIDGRRGGVAVERIRRSQDAKNDHQRRPEETCDAETAMDVDASRGDQRSLRNEQEDPAGEGGSMEVNDETGKRGAEDSGEIVSAREAGKDRGEQEQGHGGEKDVVVTASGKDWDLLHGLHGTHCDGGHRPPSASR